MSLSFFFSLSDLFMNANEGSNRRYIVENLSRGCYCVHFHTAFFVKEIYRAVKKFRFSWFIIPLAYMSERHRGHSGEFGQKRLEPILKNGVS